MNFRQLFENKTPVTDYGTWRDEINAQGGEIHPQQDRNRLVAQRWDGDVIGEFNLRTNQGYINRQQGVAEGKGDFAQAIENLHGWHEVESNNPDIRIWEFDDREGGHYAQGTVYYIEKTGRIQIEFEDRDGYHGGDVTDAFNSIGGAMNVLKNITVQVRPNTGKARDFDKLGGRTVAGPDDLYKTDRAGRKGTLNKSRMDTMKASSPYRKTGPEGQLPESGVEEATGDPKFDKMLKGITGKRQVAKQQKTDTKQQARDAFGGMFGGGNPADKLSIRNKGVAEGSDDGYGYKSLSTEQIMKLIKSGNWEAVQDVVPGKHIQLRNNRNGKSTTIHVKQDVDEGLKSKIAGAALAAANLLGSPAQAAEEPVKPITIAYVQIDGEVRKYNLGDKFSSAKEAEQFISGVLDKQGISGYTLDIKHGYPKQKQSVDENLRDWFKEKWVRFGPDGKIRGDCARGSESEGKPKCLPQAKAHALGKKGRASAAARKRKEDPNANRTGAAINVATKKKTNEVQLDEKCWDTHKQVGMKKKSGRMVPNCVPRESVEQSEMCPECGGAMYSEAMINEKKDACYYKVKASAKVWPSAYASGRLVQCRKRGSANYGKKSESKIPEDANMSQAAVRKLQNMLNTKGANLDVDGVMGPLTTKSVEKYLPAVAKRLAPDPSRTTGVQGQKPKHKDMAEGLPPMGFVRSEIKRDPLKNPTRTYIEISKMLGITPRQLQGFTLRNAGFPSPIKGIGRQAGRGTNNYYELNQVKQWIKDNNIKDQIAALVSKNVAKDQGVDEGEYKDTVDKSKIPAVQRKAQGGDWKVSTRDLEHERSKSPTGAAGLAKAKERLGMNENQQLPPEVIELLKKVAQSDAAPEHKKAIINSIMAKYQPVKDIAETPTRTAREKFNQGLKRAGFDPDAAAKRLTDLIAKQKAEREQFEKENPAVYGDTSKAPK